MKIVSKVIRILITGNSYHESSSAPQQHKQYNINGLLCTYTETFRIQTCCNHILSAADEFRGQEATCADPGIFCQFYLALSLFYSLKRGSNGFIAEKTILILFKGSRGGPLFSGGGGGPTFSRGGGGPNANFYRNPYTYLLFSRGSVRTPYPPLDPHMGNVIIKGQYLSQSGL